MSTIDRILLSRTIAVHNGKGGVLKTSLATNIAAILARADYRVLLIDTDSQGNCSDDLGCASRSDDGAELVEALSAGRPLKPPVEARENLALVPGGGLLDSFSDEVGWQGSQASDLLARSLAPVAPDYDLVLIDTPPARSVMTRAALGAARWLLVPTNTDISSQRGLIKVAESLEEARIANPDLEMLGAIITKIGARSKNIHSRVREQLHSALGTAAPVFRQTIRYAELAAEADRRRGQLPTEIAEIDAGPQVWSYLAQGIPVPDESRSLSADKKASQALASDYVRLTDELLQLLNERENSEDSDPTEGKPGVVQPGADEGAGT